MAANTAFLGEKPIRKGKIHTTHGFFLSTQFAAIRLKIPTTWVRTDWRGKFSYAVLNFPFGIGFSNAMRKSVFEPKVVVGISSTRLYIGIINLYLKLFLLEYFWHKVFKM